jgi:hypothetical protein
VRPIAGRLASEIASDRSGAFVALCRLGDAHPNLVRAESCGDVTRLLELLRPVRHLRWHCQSEFDDGLLRPPARTCSARNRTDMSELIERALKQIDIRFDDAASNADASR